MGVDVVVELDGVVVVVGGTVEVVVVGGGPVETTMSTELPGLTEDPAEGLWEMTCPGAKLLDAAELMLPTLSPF